MNDSPIVRLADVRDRNQQKEAELAYYGAVLIKLQIRLKLVLHEIAVTEEVIRLVSQERVLTPTL